MIRSWRDGWRGIADKRDDPEGAEEHGQHRGHFQLHSRQQKLVTASSSPEKYSSTSSDPQSGVCSGPLRAAGLIQLVVLVCVVPLV